MQDGRANICKMAEKSNAMTVEIRDSFFWGGGTKALSLSRFFIEADTSEDCRFSLKGVQKHHKHIFTKSPCRKLFPKKSIKCSMSVPPRLFYRGFGCFSAMGFQKHKKKRFAKEIVSKSFYQKIVIKRDFLSAFVLSRFWAFRGEGS
jgi:hypothetical protein